MTRVPDFDFYKSADIYENEKLLAISTISGWRILCHDGKGSHHILPNNVEDKLIGEALLDSLQKSRLVYCEEEPEFFILREPSPGYLEWVSRLMSFQGVKTKGSVFRKMKSCSADNRDGIIIIRPLKHERGEAWSGDGFTEADYVKVPADAPPEEIGAAVRLALSRSKR